MATALHGGLELAERLIGLLDGFGAMSTEIVSRRTKLFASFPEFPNRAANMRMLLRYSPF